MVVVATAFWCAEHATVCVGLSQALIGDQVAWYWKQKLKNVHDQFSVSLLDWFGGLRLRRAET